LNQPNLLTRLKAWRYGRRPVPVHHPIYLAWRRRFMRRRLRFGLVLAIAAYLSFIALRVILRRIGQDAVEPSWFLMAGLIEIGLLLSYILTYTRFGRRYPEAIFLTSSWCITLVEQIWNSLQAETFTSLFAWTLVFLTQATLVPVYWQVHLISQLGVLLYYFGATVVFGLSELDQSFWNASLWLYLFWFCFICDISVYLYEYLQRKEFHARQALLSEQTKSERLLLNILPESVARQLKQEHRTIADSFAGVTVLFADIVGFTQISAGIPPQDMVTLLNRIFSTFDGLVEKHNLEKIKTIGDAYMVVGGLPIAREDHIEAIADMALDMQEAIAQFDCQHERPFQMRIGIHTGPVVAGVIGVKKFIYDLWGDTVNIASRMESQGVPGCIQVTQVVYERLRHQYLFEERGAIEIKGKGKMITYLLKGKL